ncbi:uncharacterized protein LOC143183382 [Calliopsis andreniformis]|uniref:uncharacterized protein LOC143183382 n=1 Tax=Calliopsis andreniformis TaxID=337506 RepID=UPI003FCD70D4
MGTFPRETRKNCWQAKVTILRYNRTQHTHLSLSTSALIFVRRSRSTGYRERRVLVISETNSKKNELDPSTIFRTLERNRSIGGQVTRKKEEPFQRCTRGLFPGTFSRVCVRAHSYTGAQESILHRERERERDSRIGKVADRTGTGLNP